MTGTEEVIEQQEDAPEQPPATLDPWSLAAVEEAPRMEPPRIVIYGTHGVGKTTLVKHMPNHWVLFTEDGKRNLRIRRFPQVATTWEHVTMGIGRLIAGKESGAIHLDVFALDSLDWLQPIIWAEACRRHHIETIESPGYGKGYLLADEVWGELIEWLEALRSLGVAIVLLAHDEVTRFSPPDDDPYDRYDLALHKRARAMIHEWADVVAFAYEKTYTKSREEGSGKHKKTITQGAGLGGRFLALSRKSTHEAKNGYGLPDEIPLVNGPETAAELLGRIAYSFTAPDGANAPNGANEE